LGPPGGLGVRKREVKKEEMGLEAEE